MMQFLIANTFTDNLPGSPMMNKRSSRPRLLICRPILPIQACSFISLIVPKIPMSGRWKNLGSEWFRIFEGQSKKLGDYNWLIFTLTLLVFDYVTGHGKLMTDPGRHDRISARDRQPGKCIRECPAMALCRFYYFFSMRCACAAVQ
jgi:hypothetical protein